MLKFLQHNWKLLDSNRTKQTPRFFVMCKHLIGELIEDNLSSKNKWFLPVSSKDSDAQLRWELRKSKPASPYAALALAVELHAFMETDPTLRVGS